MAWPQSKALRWAAIPAALFLELLAQFRSCDVVHVHHYSWFGLFTIVAARLLGKPVLTKVPSVGENGLPGLVGSRVGRLKVAILSRSDAVVALSTQNLRELLAIGFPVDRILATPNGIRLGLPPREGGADARGRPSCRVVFVGRLHACKGLEDLLAAWRQLVTSAAGEQQLEIWGTGPLDAPLRSMASDLGLGGTVVFRGHVEAVRERLEEADVFVLPSRSEGSSNALLEAMAVGLPVVATRVGGTPLLVGASGARWLVEPGDRAALSARLAELLASEELRRGIGAAMRRRVMEHFEIGRIAERYASAYALLAAGRRCGMREISDPQITSGVLA